MTNIKTNPAMTTNHSHFALPSSSASGNKWAAPMNKNDPAKKPNNSAISPCESEIPSAAIQPRTGASASASSQPIEARRALLDPSTTPTVDTPSPKSWAITATATRLPILALA
jgi:hypothetical protein